MLKAKKILAGALLLIAQTIANAQEWLPISDLDLNIKPESALDFSKLFPASPAGSHGWATVLPNGNIGFKNHPYPEKFTATSFVFSSANGGIPDHKTSKEIANQLNLSGYNLVRFHFIDAVLMKDKINNHEIDQDSLEKIHFLMNELKKKGIYWIIDGMTSNNGTYGNIFPHRWTKKFLAKGDALLTEAGYIHWKKTIQSIWSQKNIYTGLPPLQDAALLGVILINEGGIKYLEKTDAIDKNTLRLSFLNWKKTNSEDKRPETLQYEKFIVETEIKAAERMTNEIRSMGFKGLITSYNNWDSDSEDVVRKNIQWIDMHSYHGLPSKHGMPRSQLSQASLFDSNFRYIKTLILTRQWGKPFTATEYGQLFWNKWRHESALAVPAFAAMQDWDAICQFSELPVIRNYTSQSFSRGTAIYPYAIGSDPISKGGDRISALLFRRGDIDKTNAQDQSPPPHAKTSNSILVNRTGLTKDYLDSVELKINTKESTDNITAKLIEKISSPLVELKKESTISPDKSIEINFQKETFQYKGKRSYGVILREGKSAHMDGFEVHMKKSDATVFLSSLDNLPIKKSKHMLLILLTDARNSGMEFEDKNESTLKKLGEFPPTIKSYAADIKISNINSNKLKVWPLKLSGERNEIIDSEFSSETLSIQLDPKKGNYGSMIYFEIKEK